jgi:hypothetical protein
MSAPSQPAGRVSTHGVHVPAIPDHLKDDALEESANLPAPEVIAQEVTDDLEAALEQFATIAEDLKH